MALLLIVIVVIMVLFVFLVLVGGRHLRESPAAFSAANVKPVLLLIKLHSARL